MNEVYTDLEQKNNIIQSVIEFVAQAFNLPYGDNLTITVRLPRKKIAQLSKQMIEEGKKAGLMVTQADLNEDEVVFTKYTLPQGKIEFIDNGE